jgi:guanine nucleotide-binding protein subunit alpha
MHDALMDFESLVNLKYFEKSVVILFFTKIDLFREKLSTGKAPIDELFPDYYGGPTDVIAAKEFFATKFKQLNRKSDRKCYVHFVDAIDSDLLEKAVTSVENAVIRRNLNALKPWN